jgi:hypothetical protein
MSNPNKKQDRPKLGVDLDGVVFAFDIGACVALKMFRDVDIDVRESSHWNDIQERCSTSDWRWLWNEGTRVAFDLAPAYPNVGTHLRTIQEMMDLVIITHRPRSVIDITLRKLAELRLRPIAVHHVQGYDKAHVAPDCIAYIDDKVENVLNLADECRVPVFMPKKPWNELLHVADVRGSRDIRPYDDFKEIVQWVVQTISI